MTDKKSDKMTNSSKPVPMKLFAAWEVDRTPSACIPRLCTLTVSRLRVCGGLLGTAEPAAAVSLAVRMHSSKRTLRSNDIAAPTAPGAPLDVELDLNFSLQYPHFVKRDGNRLQIMLQRRKKYKNRTILGYKTLAEGTIRMDQVLQRQMDMELELCTETGGKGGDKGGGGSAGYGGAMAISGGPTGKDATTGSTPSGFSGPPTARITITGLSSTPVDHDTKNNNTLVMTDRVYSDEEEEAEFSSVEENDDGGIGLGYNADRQRSYNKRDMSYSKQRNLKQKFAALLRRFKVPDELAERGDVRPGVALDDGDREIDELIQEWESMSCGEADDSGPEQMDSISIGSTPKPSLRPFFSSSRSLAAAGTNSTGSVGVASGRANAGRRDDAARYSVDGARSMYMAKAGSKAVGARRRQHPRPERIPLLSQGTAPVVPNRQAVDSSAQTGPNKSSAVAGTDADMMRSSGSDRLNIERADGSATSDCDQDTQYSSSEHPISPAVTLSASPPKEKDDKRSRLFRGGNNTPNQSALLGKKKHSLGIINMDQRQAHFDGLGQAVTITESRKPIGEQLCRILSPDESVVPESLAIVLPSQSLPIGTVSTAVAALSMASIPTVAPPSAADVKHVMHTLLNRIHKHCNLSAKAVQPIRLVLAGADALVAAVLRSYCELWARRPPDWATFIRFYLIPMGANSTSRHIASMDPGYAILFSSDSWMTLLERASQEPSAGDVSEICARISRYVKNTGPIVQLPVAESMIAYRDKATDEESNQTFVPFISEVRMGMTAVEGPVMASVETEEFAPTGTGSPRPSPPATPALPASGPSSYNASANSDSLVSAVRRHQTNETEAHELQIDYWQAPRVAETSRMGSSSGNASAGGSSSVTPSSVGPPDKNTLKSAFRSLQVSRTHANDGSVLPTFTILYSTKEKKQKIMRLGKKKEKDRDSDSSKSQSVEGVSRLICSSKVSHNVPLRVYIDGVEWNSVKFFQLSTQWHTHVKNFPMALTGAPLAPEELS